VDVPDCPNYWSVEWHTLVVFGCYKMGIVVRIIKWVMTVLMLVRIISPILFPLYLETVDRIFDFRFPWSRR